ncbi:MAG: D-alanyl-D-alanine carboxypeptidase, partial [Pseudomonadota bacterium]
PPGVEGAAKTGTLNFVRGLAGYITSASGRRLVFCIFSEDLARRAAMRDGRATGSSRAWGGRARGMERKLVRSWAARW